MNRKISISIGIPAYNEEANIDFLLATLINQQEISFKMQEIIVVSDGSTDATDILVRKVKDPRVKLLRNEKRIGLNQSQNRIVTQAKSDILVLLDADILPQGPLFLKNLVTPLIQKNVDLVSAKLLSLRLRSLYGRILANAYEMKRYLYTHLPQQPNVYLCHGSVRAFSRRLYKEIHWPDDVPEDSYLFFYARTHGFTFEFCPDAQVFFQTPTNLRDHLKQNTRFKLGVSQLGNYFDLSLIRNHYHIPFTNLLTAIVKYTREKPFSIPMYLCLMFLFKLVRLPKIKHHSIYEVSKSSKKWTWETLKMNRIRLEDGNFLNSN